MVELLRSNDLVYLSFVEAVLDEAGIAHVTLDTHTSSIEGSIGAIPRRVLVEEAQAERARLLLRDQGPGGEGA